MFMNKYAEYADMDVLQVLDRLSIPYEKEGSASVRLDCPACGAKGGAVVWNNTLWLNCCQGKKRHSAIDLVMIKHNVDFVTAVGILSGRFAGMAPAKQPQPAQDAVKEPFDARFWSGVVRTGAAALKPSSDIGQYLLSRGLNGDTWQRFGLGAGTRQGQRALLLPWYDQQRTLIGGRYRLLEAPDRKQRYFWWKNSDIQGHLWGWHSHQGHPALILVEGEINAMSVFQVYGDRADVLSTGSENYSLTKSNIAQLERYRLVMAWADKPETVKGWAGKIAGLIPFDSVSAGGDANDLLRAGRLASYLEI